MSDIKLNTDTLFYYETELRQINKRIIDVNLQMKTLYTSVKLVDLGKLLAADHLANFSLSLVSCANYCHDTAVEFQDLENKLAGYNPLDFTKPAVAGFEEFLYDAGKAVGAAVVKTITDIKSVWDDFYEHNRQVVEAVAAVVKSALCIAAIFGAVSAAVFCPALTPLAIMVVIGSANDLIGYELDFLNAITGNMDQIGKYNVLQSTLMWAGGSIGNLVGNREIGESIGDLCYYVTDIGSTAAGFAIGGIGIAKITSSSKISNIRKIKKTASVIKQGLKTVSSPLKNAKKYENDVNKINSSKYINKDYSWQGYLRRCNN